MRAPKTDGVFQPLQEFLHTCLVAGCQLKDATQDTQQCQHGRICLQSVMVSPRSVDINKYIEIKTVNAYTKVLSHG